MTVDLVIKNARLVFPSGVQEGGVAVDEGKIVAIAKTPNLPQASKVIDAKNHFVMPGAVDGHTHIGGKYLLEQDFKTETPGAAAGGVTTIGIMHGSARAGKTYKQFVTPEDTIPWSKAFPVAKATGESTSMIDFFYTPYLNTDEQAEEIPQLAKNYGITSFKFYGSLKTAMTTHVGPNWKMRMGMPANYDDGLIYRGFEKIGQLGNPGIALVHCENTEVAKVYMDRLRAQGRIDPPAWLERSPGWLEAEHVNRFSYYARITNSALYILHLSSRQGLAECLKSRNDGTRIIVETCPQYLIKTMYDREGVKLKVNPPIRTKEDNEALWEGVRNGSIQSLGTDHVVTSVEEKLVQGDVGGPLDDKFDASANIWCTGSGFVGMETAIPLMLSEGVHKGRITLEKLVEIYCQNPAYYLGLYPKKGAIALGSDADLVILDMDKKMKVEAGALHSYADFSIYEGMELKGWPMMTILRGEVVSENREITGKHGYGRSQYRTLGQQYCPTTVPPNVR